MALGKRQLPALAAAFEYLPETGTVLSIGDPDVYATPTQVAKALGRRLLHPVENVSDEQAAAAARRHNVLGKSMPSARSLFSALGYELTVMDAEDRPNVDVVHDLNKLLPVYLIQRYDLVLDLGCTEHVFRPGMALCTYVRVVARRGVIVHETPLWMPNHGFWQPQPKLFLNFYARNRFKVHLIESVTRSGGDRKPIDGRRHRGLPTEEETLQCVVQRKANHCGVKFPYDLER